MTGYRYEFSERCSKWLDFALEEAAMAAIRDSGEIIETVHARRAPMIPVSVSLRL